MIYHFERRIPSMITNDKQINRVHIRWMIRRDMPEVLAIESAGFDFPWPEEEFVRCLKQRNCTGMVAEHDDRVVGYMIYEFYKSTIRLRNLAVAEDCRLQGVGRQMIAKQIAKLSVERRRRLVLEVGESNLSAQLFFQRLGFRAMSVDRQLYSEVAPEDAYCFEFHILRETFYPNTLTEEKTMAEPRDKQTRMEGMHDQVPEAVQEKADEYSRLMHTRMETQRAEDTSRAELIEVMRKNEVGTCEIDGYDVSLVHLESYKIKVTKKKAAASELEADA